jgi:hypothetical protein
MQVMSQYEKKYKCFDFIGPSPIDYDTRKMHGECVWEELCHFNLKDQIKQGKTKIGIVFNTDVSTGPGEHWVAVFCDIRPELQYPRFTYFDSYAQRPEKEIQTLMKRWKLKWDVLKKHDNPMELTYNKTRHQYKDSQCGTYCLYFHYCCLTGIPMEERVPDDVVMGLRGLMFNV